MQRTAMAVTDRDLVAKATSGDADAFAALVRRYRGAVHGLAYNVAGDFDEAEDIAQRAFVTAYQKLRQLTHPDRFGPWLHQLTLNCARMAVRGRRNHSSIDDAEPLEVAVPEIGTTELEREQTRRAVRGALDLLGDDNRLVLICHCMGEMSYAEIASFLGVPVTTVEGRMHRARRQLKRSLMKMVSDTLHDERLSDDFVRKTLEASLEKAETARKRWSSDDFIHSCQEALEAAARLQDSGAQVKIMTMLGEAESTWLGEAGKATEDYTTAINAANRSHDELAEAKALREMSVACIRQGRFAEARDAAEKARKLYAGQEDRTGEALMGAAGLLTDVIGDLWQPGQLGGYAMASFPVSTQDGITFLQPEAVRHFSWGCPSRCTAFTHHHRPRRLLPSPVGPGTSWEDAIVAGERDVLSWGFAAGGTFVATSVAETDDDTVVTPAGTFERCLRVRTTILPGNRGTATGHASRSYCGSRVAWFAPGVGMVKLRHEDQNNAVWMVHLRGCEGEGGSDYFPLTVGRTWRYRWADEHIPESFFDDVCRVVSQDAGVSYVASATVGREVTAELTVDYLEQILVCERQSSDTVGEAAVLERLAAIGSDQDKATHYERLSQLYEANGDAWRLSMARWELASAKQDPTPSERVRWCKERLDIARSLEDDSKIAEALSALGWDLREAGELARSAETYKEAAGVAVAAGDIREASHLISSAEFSKAMALAPPGPNVSYAYGSAYLLEREDGKLETTGSARTAGPEHPPGPHGTPMTDLFSNCPFNGVELLTEEPGAVAIDVHNTGTVRGFVESMRLTSTLVGRGEQVNVAVGHFEDCALIETVSVTSAEDRQLGEELDQIRGYYAGSIKTWFAPGVGLVRLLQAHENGHTTDIQLVDHDVRGGCSDYIPLTNESRWHYQWTDQATGTQFDDFLTLAAHADKQWCIAFVTRATATES
jgi:RNA polymerase sigma-70 factor, ECF subfamily